MLQNTEGVENTQEDNQALGQKLIKKSFWIYFFHIIVVPTGYISKVLISHSLSVSEIGLFYSVMGLIGILGAYNDLGLTEALQYYLPKYKHNKQRNEYKTLIVITFLTQILSAIILIGIIFFGADWIAINYFHSDQAAILLKVFSLYFLFLNIAQVNFSILNAHQDVISGGITESLRMRIIVGITFFFWYTNSLTIMNYTRVWLTGIILSAIFGILIFIIKYYKTFSQGKFIFSKNLLRQQFGYAFRVFLGANVATLFGQFDQQIVMYLLGNEEAGYYSNYLSLFNTYTIFLSPLMGFLFPIYTELHTKGEIEKMKFLQNIFYKYFGVLALSFGCIFLLLGKYFAIFLFSEKFIPSGILLQQTAPFLIFNILMGLNFGLLAGIGKAKSRAISLGYGLLANIISCIVFIQYFGRGLFGAAVGSLLGWVTIFIHTYRIIRKTVPVTRDYGFYIKNFFTISLLGLAIFALIQGGHILTTLTKYNIGISIMIIGIIYYGIIGIVNYKEIVLFLKEIKKLRKV